MTHMEADPLYPSPQPSPARGEGVSRISTKLRELKRGKALLACFTAGVAMAFTFAPFYFWPLAFVCLPVFFILLDAAPKRKVAIVRALMFGYGYSMAGTWWIANALTVDIEKFGWMIPFCVGGISFALSLYFALFGYLYYKWKSECRIINLARFIVLWVAIEYLRSFGIFGFPWNLAGYSTLASMPVAQLGSLVGVYGLSLFVVGVASLPVWVIDQQEKPLRILGIVLPLILIGGAYGYGESRLQPVVPTETKVRIVQPNIPQSIKGSSAWEEQAMAVMNQLAQKDPTPADFIVWPETAYPLPIHGTHINALIPTSGTLITGALRVEGQNRASLHIYNSVVAIDTTGLLLMAYDKHQLVPFGEFVPLRSVLPLDKITPGDLDFTRGLGPQTIFLRDTKTKKELPTFSPLVCYEVIFPWMAVDPASRPQWIVNVTNDGWYGDSPGPYQHLAAAQMRALEQGLPLIRSANNGISAFIDPYGRIISALSLNERNILDNYLPQPLGATVYEKWHEWPVLLLLLAIAAMSVMAQRINKNK